MDDGYISIAIILFVLSIICERVADLLKSFLSSTNTGFGRWLGNQLGLGELNVRQSDPITEQKRSYRILKINLLCGIAVATALHADLYSIIILNNGDPMKALGWTGRLQFSSRGDFALKGITFLIGCITTGFFISFGSKFWHDALDILLQVKNYRRVLADPATLQQADNINTLQTLLSTYQSDFIKSAYLEAKSKFMAIDSVKGISLKQDNNGIYYFEITLKQYDASISPAYQYLLGDGTPVNVPIRVKVLAGNDQIRLHSLNLAAKVFNLKAPENWGTLGCIVRPLDSQSPKRYVLTCCHNVVHPITDLKNITSLDVAAVQGDMKPTTIGKIYKADRNAFMDGALIEVDARLIESRVPNLGRPAKAKVLTSADANKIYCSIYGAASQGSPLGTVTSLYASIEVDYDGETSPFLLNNLLVVSANGKAISQPGDSGCVVMDNERNVLGLVVAGSTEETYVIPIETLLLKYNVQLA